MCGSDRVDSCTPERCAGDLCPPDGAPPCGAEEPCAGALPNANKAIQDADEVKDKLQDLNNKITQAAAQVPQHTFTIITLELYYKKAKFI